MNINRKWVYPLAAAGLLLVSGCSSTGTATGPTSAAPTGTSSTSMSSPASTAASTSSSGTGAASTGSGDSMAMMIHIKDFAFQGPDAVAAGSTVSVMNMDAEAHTVTADDGTFNVVAKPGETATFTAPAKPGSYKYHCTYHSNMHGTLTVK